MGTLNKIFLNGNAQVFWDRPACRLRASWSNLLSIVAQAFIENEATVDEDASHSDSVGSSCCASTGCIP